MHIDPRTIEVIAPNLKRRLSGVTATIARLVPIQSGMIGIAATGPGLPLVASRKARRTMSQQRSGVSMRKTFLV